MDTSELVLYSIMAVMTAAALAIILPSLLKKGAEDEAQNELHQTELTEALRTELTRLDEDLSAGRIDVILHEKLVADLKRRAIEESSSEKLKFEKDDDKSRAVRVTAAFNIIVLLSAALYWLLGAPEVMRLYKHQQVLEGKAAAEDIEIYLESNANDGRAWVLLAHRFVDEGEFDKAVQAYRQAMAASRKVASDPDVMLETAAAILTTGRKNLFNEAKSLLEKVLSIQPENLQAVELLAIAAMALEDWQLELAMEEIMMQNMDPGSLQFKRMHDRTRQLRLLIENQNAADSIEK